MNKLFVLIFNSEPTLSSTFLAFPHSFIGRREILTYVELCWFTGWGLRVLHVPVRPKTKKVRPMEDQVWKAIFQKDQVWYSGWRWTLENKLSWHLATIQGFPGLGILGLWLPRHPFLPDGGSETFISVVGNIFGDKMCFSLFFLKMLLPQRFYFSVR